MLLTLEELQKRLSQITYKKGYNMRLYQGETEGIMFELIANVDDSVNKGEKVPLEIYSVVPPQISEYSFDLWLFDRLKRVEIHECAEFLQVDGKPLFNPHKEGADKPRLIYKLAQKGRIEHAQNIYGGIRI